MYAYVDNQPTNAVDPMGLKITKCKCTESGTGGDNYGSVVETETTVFITTGTCAKACNAGTEGTWIRITRTGTAVTLTRDEALVLEQA